MNEPMAKHTTFQVGGPVKYAALAASADELKAALAEAAENGVAVRVIGRGSNLLVADRGFDGLIVILGDAFSRVAADGETVTAEAGLSLARLARTAQENGLAGLEFASGIPGSVGGGVFMNAGAYGGMLGDVIESVTLLGPEGIVTVPGGEMGFGYRMSRAKRTGEIVLGAKFRLTKDDPAAILARMNELNARRREKQPLNYPSAGSTFKRPEGYFAGALIEQAGLKGTRAGGASVSGKHAGFIVNDGGATAADIRSLIRLVQDRVFAMSGVTLEPEVEMIGFED